jgi:hypothetical protein
MKFLTLIITILSISSSFAGEMKKIDTATRETVANTYYVGFDSDEYYDFMYNEIWNVKLESKKYEGCLVVVSGFTTETILEQRSEIPFKVCINKDKSNDYSGKLLNL